MERQSSASSKAGSHTLAGKVCQRLPLRSMRLVFRKQQANEHIPAAEPLYDERRDIINGTKEAPEQPNIRDDEPGQQPERPQLWGALKSP